MFAAEAESNERKENNMNILTKTMQTVKDYESAMQTARKEFENTKEQIFATYSNTVAAEKLGDARDAMTAFEMKESVSASDVVKADFAEARDAVFEFVSKSVPEDFPATLSIVQVKGAKISDFEAASFLKKYEGNYTAYSAILDILNRNGKAGSVYVMTPDKLNDDIAVIEKRVLNWIQNRTSGDFDSEYYSRLFTADSGNPIRALAIKIESFISGGFILDNSHNIAVFEMD